MTSVSDNTSHVIAQNKTCTDKLIRPIDLFDPWEAALNETYLDTHDYKSMFFYQSEEQAK